MDKVFIAGAGGIGRAAALLILEAQDWDAQVVLGDVSEDQLNSAKEWVEAGIGKTNRLELFKMPDASDLEAFRVTLHNADVMLDCLPGEFAPAMARLCIEYTLHYANLTEYVDESNQIMEMAKDAETGFILQTGLAPGYINNLAIHLAETFMEKYDVDALESMSMRVGALTQFTESPHYYGFTWSTIGVATEYIQPSIVVRNHEVTQRPSISERETILINGRRYEADLTSGGAADLPEAFKEQIRNIDYKTIRYPGHFDWVSKNTPESGNADQKIDALQDYMVRNVPHMEDDVVVIYASVTGYDKHGVFRCIQHAGHIYPLVVGRVTMRAIQTCTAAPLVECARLLMSGEYAGVVTQSQINPSAILNGTVVKQAYQSEFHD